MKSVKTIADQFSQTLEETGLEHTRVFVPVHRALLARAVRTARNSINVKADEV
ncbi:MAG: hypothetical protein AAAC47_12175 [Pararhizobium sp.]